MGFEALDVGQEPEVTVKLELLSQALCPETLLAHDGSVSAPGKLRATHGEKKGGSGSVALCKEAAFASPTLI